MRCNVQGALRIGFIGGYFRGYSGGTRPRLYLSAGCRIGAIPIPSSTFPWSIRQLDPNRPPPDDAGRVGWAIEAGPGDFL